MQNNIIKYNNKYCVCNNITYYYIAILYFNTSHCVRIPYTIRCSNMLYSLWPGSNRLYHTAWCAVGYSVLSGFVFFCHYATQGCTGDYIKIFI